MTAPVITATGIVVWHGDCLDIMRQLPDASIDAVVTDPPYGLEFMGKEWDSFEIAPRRDPATGGTQAPFAAHALPLTPARNAAFGAWCEQWTAECLRVLKPGGHLLAFGGSRTWHRLACAVEDAGFEIRDSIAWLYGSGFPKSLDVSKAIDKAAGATREVVGPSARHGGGIVGAGSSYEMAPDIPMLTAPATPDAERWQGWGTALKPAFEPIVVGRKPLTGTVAANVLAHGTGALNIDACRTAADDAPGGRLRHGGGSAVSDSMAGPLDPSVRPAAPAGRWPTNVVLDGSQADALDQQTGITRSPKSYTRAGTADDHDVYATAANYGDSGGASRFFPTFRYQAKAPSKERPKVDGVAHPTVKPLELMRWLVRLVTPPGGIVLDPFAGTGTTLQAARDESFTAFGIERTDEYLPLIRHRLGLEQPEQSDDLPT